MARPNPPFFLDHHLSAAAAGGPSPAPHPPPPPSVVIAAWSELRRASSSSPTATSAAVRTLASFGPSLHVADAHANLLLSLPTSASPSLFRLLHLWLRRSPSPSSSPVLPSIASAAAAAVSSPDAGAGLLAAGVLLLGAVVAVPGLSKASKTRCLELLCGVVQGKRVGLAGDHAAELLAGVGYALFAAKDSDFVRVFSGLLGGGVGASRLPLDHGLMILHLMEWIVSSLVDSGSHEKVRIACVELSKYHERKYSKQVVVMAAAGILRGLNGNNTVRAATDLRSLVEGTIVSIAMGLIPRTEKFDLGGYDDDDDNSVKVLLQFVALGLARSGPCSFHPSLVACLAVSLMAEVFPLPIYYRRAIENSLTVEEVRMHCGSALFRGAGAITSAFCNQYVLADEESKLLVEDRMWKYCRESYWNHRLAKFGLENGRNDLLVDLDKVSESAFLMVVVFASVVAKKNANLSSEVSVKILVAFSCLEYFRRVRMPEYSDTIRTVVNGIQHESSSIAFVHSMPSYSELTYQEGYVKKKYLWAADEVQTARILFYLRVIPTCIEHIPLQVFTNVVVPTMFLYPFDICFWLMKLIRYMRHPTGKVARAAHTVFASFLSSGKDSDNEERAMLNEQLIFFYIERSLEVYPSITPYEGLASGIVALIRHAPAGSPAIIFCIHKLVDKATSLCYEDVKKNAQMWKNWHEDTGPNKKIVDLLLRLILLVDVQVLPELLKLLAQFVIQLPKDGQKVVLGHLFSQVAESDDVTRKPSLVSWLNSVSYLCSASRRKDVEAGDSRQKASDNNVLSLNTTISRL